MRLTTAGSCQGGEMVAWWLMPDWTPPNQVNLVDHSFMDARYKLIDIAAFLDRVQRAGQTGDYRYEQFREAVKCLASNEPTRAREVLMTFSDPTVEPIPEAHTQGAAGAYRA